MMHGQAFERNGGCYWPLFCMRRDAWSESDYQSNYPQFEAALAIERTFVIIKNASCRVNQWMQWLCGRLHGWHLGNFLSTFRCLMLWNDTNKSDFTSIQCNCRRKVSKPTTQAVHTSLLVTVHSLNCWSTNFRYNVDHSCHFRKYLLLNV